MVKLSHIYFVFLFSQIINFKSYSLEKTFVFCSNNEANWYWLKDSNNNYVYVMGKWEFWKFGTVFNNASFSYFIPQDSLKEIMELSKKCSKAFGSDYFTPQPANYNTSRWSVFAIDGETFMNGILQIDFIPPTSYMIMTFPGLFEFGNPGFLTITKSEKITRILNKNFKVPLLFK
ncbi:hypothetical protein [Silvanigrella aquatica]|uniref:Uncharacterized protein n=1 Tax=Silvanigrella aquatica TaxID=1915309 RepID=A0A1L4D3B0_9BACT|nr:hypothetical protein [Silvanigrella aquatica]APJ04695.1 hypothetical protein AXG55_12600 [Silvanigrella aquatica]